MRIYGQRDANGAELSDLKRYLHSVTKLGVIVVGFFLVSLLGFVVAFLLGA